MQETTIGAVPGGHSQGGGSPAALAAAARRHRVSQLGDRADVLDRKVMDELRNEPGWADLLAADTALLTPADPVDVALAFDEVPWAAPAATGWR